MTIEKFITDRGYLTLSEIYPKYKVAAREAAREVLNGLYAEVKSTTEEYPRLNCHRIHVSTPEELAKKADIGFMVAAHIEFDTVVGRLAFQDELLSSSLDLKRVVVGYCGDTICLVGQAMEKRAIRAYGTAVALFPLAKLRRFFFKVGGAAAGGNKIGTIPVLCRGPDGIVSHGQTVPGVNSCSLYKNDLFIFSSDRYMREDVKEGQNLSATTTCLPTTPTSGSFPASRHSSTEN